MKKLIVFDLDGTLAESKSSLDAEMAMLLSALIVAGSNKKVAEQIVEVMGKRVTLHYEEKVGLPTSCFGETRHYVTKVTVANDISLSPGVVVHTQPADASASAPAR